MREIIELIRKHPKMRHILRCEPPYFHHWFKVHVSTNFCSEFVKIQHFRMLKYLKL